MDVDKISGQPVVDKNELISNPLIELSFQPAQTERNP
jgi:hypothetical protein